MFANADKRARQHVLVVDDEPAVQTSLSRALEFDGYEATIAASGADALAAVDARGFDAILLDVSMPGGIDGLEVCRRLRAGGDMIPVLMLTARDAVDDRVAGLESGADDYLVKPFALRELMARLRALLRRADRSEPRGVALEFADIRLDRDEHVVTRGDRVIDLSLTEFGLLEVLMENPKRVLSRGQIFEAVWGYDFGPTSNALGVYISYLRRKLEAGGAARVIHTVRGVGYVLRESP